MPDVRMQHKRTVHAHASLLLSFCTNSRNYSLRFGFIREINLETQHFESLPISNYKRQIEIDTHLASLCMHAGLYVTTLILIFAAPHFL